MFIALEGHEDPMYGGQAWDMTGACCGSGSWFILDRDHPTFSMLIPRIHRRVQDVNI